MDRFWPVPLAHPERLVLDRLCLIRNVLDVLTPYIVLDLSIAKINHVISHFFPRQRLPPM